MPSLRLLERLLAWYASRNELNWSLILIFLGIFSREGDLCRCRCPPFSVYPILSLPSSDCNARIPQAARNVRSSQETLIDIFERIENFFRRLEVYTEVPPTAEMMDMMVKIMVEILSILGIATKEIKQGRTSE